MKWVYTPKLQSIFGSCLDTVFRGKHFVIVYDKKSDDYVIIASATKREYARAARKGDCYTQLKETHKL